MRGRSVKTSHPAGVKAGREFDFTFELTIFFSDVGFRRICGEDPNFSILEVENTDLCLTPQTGERRLASKM